MKKTRFLLFALLIVCNSSAAAAAQAGAAPVKLEARNILVAGLKDDLSADEIIFERNSGELIYPASTIKMLVALTALDITQPEEKVRVGLEFFLVPPDASRAGLKFPMKLTVRELLEGLLLPSGADAAYTLAVYCGGKLENGKDMTPQEAMARFVEEMNRKAAAIGAEHTTVVNTDGYDVNGQQTTAGDLLLIAEAFLRQPLLAELCAMPEAELTGERGTVIPIRNTNEMLHEESPFFNGNVTGIKTGTTSLAGCCLVSSFCVREKKYVCIVMNSSDEGRYTDTQKLFLMCLAKAWQQGLHEEKQK